MPSLLPDQVARLRLLQGEVSAVDAAKALNVSPETVRRLWRGETHFKGVRVEMGEGVMEESLEHLKHLLEDKPSPVEPGEEKEG